MFDKWQKVTLQAGRFRNVMIQISDKSSKIYKESGKIGIEG